MPCYQQEDHSCPANRSEPQGGEAARFAACKKLLQLAFGTAQPFAQEGGGASA